MINPKELKHGVYKGREPIGPGVYQTLIVIIRGEAPFFEIKVIAERNNGLFEIPNAIGRVGNGYFQILERVCDL